MILITTFQNLFADALTTTYSHTQPRRILLYGPLSTSLLPSSSTLTGSVSRGYERVRHLAAELGEGYTFTVGETPETLDARKGDSPPQGRKVAATGPFENLHALTVQCATDAVDLLEELEIVRLSAHFRDFGKELGVADAKSLEGSRSSR